MKGHPGQSGSGTSRKPRQTRRLLFFGALLALTAYNVHRLLQSSQTPQIQRKLMTNSESKKLEDVTSIQGDSQLKAGGGVTETTRNGDNSGNAASKRQVSNQSQVHKSKAGAIVAGIHNTTAAIVMLSASRCSPSHTSKCCAAVSIFFTRRPRKRELNCSALQGEMLVGPKRGSATLRLTLSMTGMW